MNDVNLADLSGEALRAMKEAIAREETERNESRIVGVRNEIDAILQKNQLSLGEVYPGKPRQPRSVKYRDPQNPSDTWAGFGRRPKWLTALLKADKSLKLKDFAV